MAVARHFRWMKEYGLDGVLVQRFVDRIPGNRAGGDVVLKERHGGSRAIRACFRHRVRRDRRRPGHLRADASKDDWKYLVDDLHVAAVPGVPAP